MDMWLLVTIILLVGFGLIVMTSASYPKGIDRGDGLYYAKRQLVSIIIGIIGSFIILRLPKGFIKNISGPMFLISLVLVAALWTPLAVKTYGQARWINIPGTVISFQPSDFIKVTSVLYLSKVLEENVNKMDTTEAFIKIVAVMAMAVVPIMIRDFSTAIVIGFSLLAIYIVGGLNLHQFISLLGIGVAGAVFMIINAPYRVKRILGFFNQDASLQADNYQINQSLYAIAMGGVGGVGFFRSRQKYTNVPMAHNDFIFPIICEEFGILGAVFLIGLFISFIFRGLVISAGQKDLYSKYVGVGITSYIGVQALFNLGVGCGLFPVTGITLPFISYGGTSIIITICSAALLLKISKEAL